jgi:hypothetical protein
LGLCFAAKTGLRGGELLLFAGCGLVVAGRAVPRAP